jgi:hypothetical protein
MQMTDGLVVKELTDIQTKGCPDGIEAIDVSGMDTWVFSIAVLGEETVYRVSRSPKVSLASRSSYLRAFTKSPKGLRGLTGRERSLL